MGIKEWLKDQFSYDNNVAKGSWLDNLLSNPSPDPGYDAQGNPIRPNPNPNPYNIPGGPGVGYGDNGYRPPANPSVGSDPFGPDTSWIDTLMSGLMNKDFSGKKEGAAAAAAYNPVFASLAAEKLAAQRRGKQNQKDIKGAYSALADDYVRQAAAEVKGHAKATKEQNKAFSKDVFETKDAYTKIRAESDAEAARLGQTGTSAQQIADQKIGMASAQAVDAERYQQNMNKAASDQTSKSQENYMKRGAMIAPQAGAEQVNISKNKLEDVLLGLNKEEAQARLQQTAARIQAQSQAQKGPDISAILALTNEKQDIIDRYNQTGQTIDPTKLKGLASAYSYGSQLAAIPSSGVTAESLNQFMNAFQSDADINNGTYQDPKTKKQVKMTKEMKNQKLYTFAVQAGIPTAVARQIAEIYTRGV